MLKKVIWGAMAVVALVSMGAQSGCNDADIASRNLSVAADNFEVMRRVVFYNGITGDYILSVEGLCSLGNQDSQGQLSVTCKTGPRAFTKHFLGLSDNVTYFAQQLENVDVSTYHHRIIFKPQSILPDIDFKGSGNELLNNHNNDG